MKLKDKVTSISGVGEKRAERLKNLNIETVEDMLTHFPRQYEDRTEFVKIDSVTLNEKNIIKGHIVKKYRSMKFGKLLVTKMKVKDISGYIEVIWYNQPYMYNVLNVDDEVVFIGKVQKKYGKLTMNVSEYEKFNKNSKGIIPIYPLTYKISQKYIRKTIRKVINELKEKLNDFIPENIKGKYDLIDYKKAIKNIHFPENNEEFFKARKRLVFEEFFLVQLGLSYIKSDIKSEIKGLKFDKCNINIELPFELTNAQKRVLEEIKSDMNSEKVMNRLVQGDVGSGKTVVAMLAMRMAVCTGYQSVMMAPTEVLAKQHFKNIKEYCIDLNVSLLTGSLSKKEKEKTYKDLKSGELDILIGTHAVIQDNVEFKKLGLVITDEQHRFGVRQRKVLSDKGNNPDVLVMTATPIPRSLALILYGDLDISIIDEMPKGRKDIETYVVDDTYNERLYGFIEKEIEKGRQTYIVCPMIEESEDIDGLKNVLDYTKKIKKRFKNKNVEYLHGKMKSKEKNNIMQDFADGNIDILVSTTVIEVGVDVSNATLMIIENAERFGLAQLHQLRGRVGRGEYKSYCILKTDCKTDICKKRMEIMSKSSDGFYISEKDLELRGPGDFFGTRQHGIPEFKIANLYKDMDILKLAQKAANDIIQKDKNLSDYKKLKGKIANLFKDRISL